MSTLNVSNITDGTTTVGTSYVVNGSAKAWVNFNGQGTIAARDSLNVSSLTDNATGNYTINVASAFANNDFAPSFMSGFEASANERDVTITGPAFTTSAFSIQTSLSGTNDDEPVVTGSVQGDLA